MKHKSIDVGQMSRYIRPSGWGHWDRPFVQPLLGSQSKALFDLFVGSFTQTKTISAQDIGWGNLGYSTVPTSSFAF